MVSKSQLLQSSGIVNLQKRQQQSKTSQVEQPQFSQIDIERNKAEQKKYEEDLKKYEQDSAEYAARKLVYEFAVTGRENLIGGLAYHGTPTEKAIALEYLSEGWTRGKAQSKADQLAKSQAPIAPKAPSGGVFVSSSNKPTVTDSLGQGISVAPTLDLTRNTYNPKTGVYISEAGAGYSMAKAPEKARIVDTTLYDSFKRTQINKPSISQETQRYQDLGYTKPQAQKLATESVRQGGMTYSPERAKEIIRPRVGEVIRDVYIASSPITLGARANVEKVGMYKEYKSGKEDTKKIQNIEAERDRLIRGIQEVEQVYGDTKTNTINLEGKKLEEYKKSYEELERLNKEYEKLGAKKDEQGNYFKPTEIRGMFGVGEEYSKADVYKKSELPEPIGFISSIPRMVGTDIGGFLSVTGKDLGLNVGFNTPEMKFISTYKDYKGKNIMINGKAVRKEVTVPSQRINILTPKILQTVGEATPYLNPAGMDIFLVESGLTLTGKAIKEGSIKGGITGYATDYTGEALGLATFGLFKGAGATKKFFKPEFRVVEENTPKQLLNLGEGQGKNIMSKSLYEIKTGDTATTLREFKGTGVGGESIRKGRRTIYVSPFQKLFRLKPTYSGNIFGEKVVYTERKSLPFLKEKVFAISREEAKKGYEKALKELIENRGFTKSQAKNYLRRYKPSYEVSQVDYSGIVGTQFGGKKPLTGVGIVGKRTTYKPRQPIIVDLGKGMETIALSKGGKTKVVDVTTGLEELKIIIPKGKEAGALGELTLFGGKSNEFDKLARLGRRAKQYQDVAIARKTGEIKLGEEGQLGSIEYYRTGSVSKDITYRIPRRISTEVSNVEVINPALQKEVIIDYTYGIKTTRVKPTIETTNLGTFTQEDWITISEEKLPFREIPKGMIQRPANIKKTPLSKTFGNLELPKQILESPKPTQEAKAIAEEASKLLKAPIPKKIPKIKQLPASLEVQDNLPRMVGGTGKGVSAYEGTGQYETTELTPTLQPSIVSRTFVENKPAQTNIHVQKQNINLQFRQPQIDLLKSNLKTNEMLRIKEILKTNEILKPVEKTKVQERTRLNELVKMAQQVKQQQRMQQGQKLGLKQTAKQQLKLNPPKEPKIKVPFKIKSPLVKKLGKKAEEGEFEAFAFKLGKEISIAKGTKEQVTGELGSFLQKELSASGYLTRGGKKIKAEETGLLGTEFRKSRTKNPYLIVEEKSLRLRKSGTGKLIQKFRF